MTRDQLTPAVRGVCIAILISLTGCTKFDLLNATVGSCGYVRTADITYGDRARQKLDVYRPRDVQHGAGVVIFFYGGDWQTGSKNDYAFVGEALSSRGFVAVLPDYRLYPEVTFPRFVEDGAAAVRWAHDYAARFGGDPAHIYLIGHSAGAHIAALLTLDGHYLKDVGLDRNLIRATAALSGPYDFVPPPEDRAPFGMGRSDTQPDPAIEPTHFVDGHAPPMLLIRGLKDTVVGPENGARLLAAIRRAGGKVECIDYPDRGHAGIVQSLAWPFRWLAPVLDDTAAFFRRN